VDRNGLCRVIAIDDKATAEVTTSANWNLKASPGGPLARCGGGSWARDRVGGRQERQPRHRALRLVLIKPSACFWCWIVHVCWVLALRGCFSTGLVPAGSVKRRWEPTQAPAVNCACLLRPCSWRSGSPVEIAPASKLVSGRAEPGSEKIRTRLDRQPGLHPYRPWASASLLRSRTPRSDALFLLLGQKGIGGCASAVAHTVVLRYTGIGPKAPGSDRLHCSVHVACRGSRRAAAALWGLILSSSSVRQVCSG